MASTTRAPRTARTADPRRIHRTRHAARRQFEGGRGTERQRAIAESYGA